MPLPVGALTGSGYPHVRLEWLEVASCTHHEFCCDTHLGLLSELEKPVWEHLAVHFLEKRVLELDGVRILGYTLWSGFNLYGADVAEGCMTVANRSISDYWMTNGHGGKRLPPRDTGRLHRTAVGWLDSVLATPFDGKTVVVTHVSRHRRCVVTQHAGSDVTPYFVTDLSHLMRNYGRFLWPEALELSDPFLLSCAKQLRTTRRHGKVGTYMAYRGMAWWCGFLSTLNVQRVSRSLGLVPLETQRDVRLCGAEEPV